MKARLPVFLVVTAALCTTYARDVRYDFTGTYDATTPTTSLTVPGGAFTFEFLVPESVPNDTPFNQPFYISTPLLSGSYTVQGRAVSLSSGTYFYANSDYNSASIDLNTPAADISLFFYGSGALAGRPDASGLSHFETGNLSGNPENNMVSSITFTPPRAAGFTIDNVPVSVVGTPVSAPEPSSLGLMVVGVIACGGIAWGRRRRDFQNRHGGLGARFACPARSLAR
ncbi:MAG TPA: PEP-CTERM sorting domain-containing protein [Chthoniobacterales bacterium]